MNSLSKLVSAKNIKPKRRVGRGHSTGKGKTSGRGHKGYKSRSGSSSRLKFEGGQMSIIQRIPKLKGFKALKQEKNEVINLKDFEKYAENGKISKKILLKKKILKKGYKLYILGTGEIDKPYEVTADKISNTAQEKIEKAGGKIVVSSK